MDLTLLGKILATVVTAAVDAGAIAASSGGILTNPVAVGQIAQGFLNIWLTHPASGAPQAPVISKGIIDVSATREPVDARPPSAVE